MKQGIIKRALAKLAGSLGYVPAKRNFYAAASNRLTADWSSYSQTIDTIIRWDLPALRARSRELSRNNPYVQKFIFMLKANVLGDAGLALKMKAKERDVVVNNTVKPGALDVFANKAIEDNWWKWGRRGSCTIDGRLCWEDVQRLALSTAAIDGEFVVRTISGPAAGNAWGFTLQIFDSERLDIKKTERLANGNVVNMGVEVDGYNRPVAFWFLKRSPNDYATPYPIETVATEHERIDASEIIHPYLLRYVGQSRGFPWMAPVMLNTQMLGGYEEAELVASRAAANKFAVIETTGEQQYVGETDPHQMTAEPGSIEHLPPNTTLKQVDWSHPNSGYGAFVKSALRGIAAGLNVNYATLANDLEAVNFSSGRMGQMEEREHWRYLQSWLAETLCQPVFERWLIASLASGKIGLPLSKFEKFKEPTWQGRRWSWVDPTKEVSAKIQELNSGLTSLTRVLGEMGIDRDELLDEIADDKAALESRGIELPELWKEEPDPVLPQVAPMDDRKNKVRYNENHDPENGQFTSGDGGAGGGSGGGGGGGGGVSGSEKSKGEKSRRERLRDRIEGTQKEANKEVSKTAKEVAKIKDEIAVIKSQMEASKAKYDAQLAKVTADAKAKLTEFLNSKYK